MGALAYSSYGFITRPNHDPTSRVCEEVGRALTERELIDRFFFKEKASQMTLEEKKQIMLSNRGGMFYPECCYIEDFENAWIVKDRDKDRISYMPPHYKILDYGLVWHSKDYTGELEYENSIYVVDSCGRELYDISGSYSSGERISKDFYENRIRKIKTYWEEKGEK